MFQKLNWMLINEIENEITNVLLRSDVYGEFVCHFVKLVALNTKLSARKRIRSFENEVEFLKMKLSKRKWNRMPENEITCIFFEIDTGISTSNQFRCEIESPFTNLKLNKYEIGWENLLTYILLHDMIMPFCNYDYFFM